MLNKDKKNVALLEREMHYGITRVKRNHYYKIECRNCFPVDIWLTYERQGTQSTVLNVSVTRVVDHKC